MSPLPDDESFKHQVVRIEGELPGLTGEAHVRVPVPAREQSTLESLSSAFRGLGGMTRASTQPSRTTTYASFSPTSPTFSNNLMLSDDDGGPDETIYGNRLSIDIPGNENIVWSGWDEVVWNGHNIPSRLLLLGYRGGIQVWDCTHEQVREVLNLISPTIGGAVIGAAVIPAPASSQDDLLSEERPLLAILTSRPDELVIYSLRTHAILKQLAFNSPQAIQASDQFIVISTVAPPALHILNSVDFSHLSTISAPHVALPVFSLSRRVLAYASAPPPPSTSPTPTPSSASPSKVQADISMAIEGARKVGVGMWSGVKSLLRESNTPRSPSTYSPALRSPTPMSPTMLGSPRIYSRSAPSEASYSTGSPLPRVTVSATGEPRPATSQGHVTVVDLQPLLSGAQAPRRIIQHHATPGQAVSVLAFSRAGNLLAVTGADGIFVRIFEVRPKGRYAKGGPRLTKRDELNELEERDTGSLWHWYDLQRGLTRRRITNIVWSADSKWISVVTVRGTLHIFAINPYGGIPLGASHLLGSGRIANMTEPPRAPLSLSPILRIHMLSGITTSDTQPQQKGVPVTATFGRPSKPDRESAAQDIFVLNRATGELMLKQCVVRMQSASAIERSMQASMSLPSALSNSVAGTGVSALSSMMRGGVGAVAGERDDLVLGGAEALGKTWGIVKREKEWGEVRKAVEWTGAGQKPSKKAKSSKSEWLAQAEITTCTRSLKLLPGPIYLSHQFAFLGLCRDWEALLQQSHLNLPATKITVRREVSARPIADSGSEGAFLGSGTEDMFAASMSLDETLASAITGSLSPTLQAQQIPTPIPSFPNAYSGGKGSSWNDPVRRLSRFSDGLGQGLGSLKREIGKVRPPSGPGERRARSPKSSPPVVDTEPGITLEFDEDDALFEVDEDLPPSNIEEPVQGGGLQPSREDDASRSAESGSGSVPSTVPDMTMLTSPELAGDWPGDDDSFGGEEEEYIQARAEDDRFDDLVVGLMDEEEEERRVVMESATSIKKKHKKKR